MPPLSKVINTRPDLLQGTLDLIVLRALSLGTMHGFGIAQRIQQVSRDILSVNQGSLYPALLRLEERGWIKSEWGVSENNRRARFYSITAKGTRQLEQEIAQWQRMSRGISWLLNATPESL